MANDYNGKCDDKRRCCSLKTETLGSDTKIPSLRKNFSWSLFGNLFYGGAQWAMIILIAKYGTPIMLGEFTIAFALSAPVFMFANLNLRGVLATDAAQDYCFFHYLILRIIMTILSMLFLIALVAFLRYETRLTCIILIISTAKSFEAISDIYYGLFNKVERMDKVAISLLFKGILSLILLYAALYFYQDILWGCVALVFSWGLTFSIVDYPNSLVFLQLKNNEKKNSADKYEKLFSILRSGRIVSLFKIALPLGFATLLSSLLINIPRYFVENTIGVYELGIFAAMSHMVIIGSRVVTSLGQSMSPRLAHLYSANNIDGFVRLIGKSIVISVMISLVVLFMITCFGREVLVFLYSDEYAKELPAFKLIVISAIISYIAILLGFGLTALRVFKPQAIILITSIIILSILCYFLMQNLYLEGAALSLVAGATVQLLGNTLVMWRKIYEIRRAENDF